ncbi:MAG: gephyrin-like molybdotransferase Glp [Thermodesulfobacteriota bacterium]
MDKGFFRVVSPREFIALLGRFPPLAPETVDLDTAHGRFLALDVPAAEDLPPHSRAAMDGYAVRAADVFGAGESNPAYLDCVMDVPIGVLPDRPLPPGSCARIVTGGMLPGGADAVVMVEHTLDMGAGTVEFRRSAAPGDHVMHQGEDARAGQTALPAGRRLRAQEIGLLAALGMTRPTVGGVPRVAIVSTGDELVPAHATPPPGGIRDVNTHALTCLVRDYGGVPLPLGLVPDDEAAIRDALTRALAAGDMVLVSGGSSVGARDFTLATLADLPDSEILAHGVAVSPGKPTILARVGHKPVIGLPGQVASAQVVMTLFGKPLIEHLAGDPKALTRSPFTFPAVLARNLASKPGREDHVRVCLEPRPGDLPLAHPALGRSGLLKTLLDADGLITIEADAEGLDAGTRVEVRPL